MSAKRFKHDTPKSKGRRRKGPDGGCPYCIQGTIAVGQNSDGLPITVECGYCHGKNNRKHK